MASGEGGGVNRAGAAQAELRTLPLKTTSPKVNLLDGRL